MHNLYKITSVGAKLLEILGYIAIMITSVILVLCAVSKESVLSVVNSEQFRIQPSSIGNLDIQLQGKIAEIGVVVCFLIGIMGAALCLAVIARAVSHLFAEIVKGNSPFTQKTTLKIKKIGAAFIGFNMFDLVLTFVFRAVNQSSHLVITIGFNGILMGLLIFCLAGIFSYGIGLQKEVDELL